MKMMTYGAIAAATQVLLSLTVLNGQKETVIALLFGTAFAALAGSILGTARELRLEA